MATSSLRGFHLLSLTLLFAAGCAGCRQEAALLAVVQVEGGVRATCLRVEALDTDGAALARTDFAAEGKAEYRVAIFQDDLPDDIRVRASALWGQGCAEPLLPNGTSPVLPARFSREEIGTVTLALAAPDATLDADRDGFIGAVAGGPDCDDQRALAFPGAQESCLTLDDLDCDGLAGCADPACAGVACAEPPSRLAWLTPARTSTAGDCSEEVVLESQDAAGAAAAVAAETPIALAASPAAGFSFFSDETCANALAMVTLARGEARARAFFRATAAGTVEVTASSQTLAQALQAHEVVAGPPSVLAFGTPSRTAVAGACSEAVTLQAQDALGNPSPVGAPVTLALAAEPADGFSFFAAAGCGGAGSSTAALPAGSSEATFYFRGTRAGQVQVTASGGAFAAASQLQSVQVGPPASLVFTTAGHALTAGDCSGALAVEARDAHGNPSPVPQATAVTLSALPSDGVTFHSDAGCANLVTAATLPAGGATATFRFRGTRTGSVTVTASAPFGQAAQPQSVASGAGAALVFTTAPQTLQAGSCSGGVTVQRRDGHGNPTAVGGSLQVQLTTLPADAVDFFADAACAVPISALTLAATSGTFHFSGATAGAPTLTASAAGLTSAMQTATLTSGPPTALVFSSAPQTLTAGACSAQAILEIRDAFGNVVPAGSATVVTLAAVPGTGFAFFSDATCTTAATTVSVPAQGTGAGFYFRGNASGEVEVTATAPGFIPADQQQTVVPAAPFKLRFSTAPQTVPLNQCSNAITVQVADTLDNPSPVPGSTTVGLSGVPAGGMTFYSDAGCVSPVIEVIVAQGEASADFHFKSSALGMVTVDATASGLQGASQSHTVEQGAAALAFTTAPQTRWAGECSGVVTVQSRDITGVQTAVGADTVVSLTANPAAGFGFYSNAACTTPISEVTILQGQSNASFRFKGMTGGAVTMTASANQFTPAGQVATINASRSFGTCTFTAGTSEATCAINPPLPDVNKTLLFYQATLNHSEARRVLTRCFIENASTLRCTRGDDPSDVVNVTWRTLYFPTGVSVRHLISTCNSGNTITNIPVSPTVNVASSFVLFGMDYAANGYNSDVFATAELSANNNVRITRNAGGCGNSPRYAVQVVEWQGAAVSRGTITGGIPNGGTSTELTGQPAVDPTRTFLLYTWRSNTGNMNGRMVRGSLPNATTLRFERNTALTDGVTAIHWQRIQLPLGNEVQQVALSVSGGNNSSGPGTISAVDLTRSVVFSGGQSIGGTADGMGAQGNARPDNMMARFIFNNATQVYATRARTESSASWTAWVVQFQP